MPSSSPSSTDKGCPICGKPTVERFRPFCSKRCADIDLHRWLAGSYAVPAIESDEPEAAGETRDRDSSADE